MTDHKQADAEFEREFGPKPFPPNIDQYMVRKQAYQDGYRAAHASQQAIIDEQAKQIEVLREALSKIMNAHNSKNNGAYMGEAVVCHMFEVQANEALAATAPKETK